MCKYTLCLAAMPDFNLPITEQIKLFKKIGFDGFFTHWSPDQPIAEYARVAKAEGMLYQSIHAPQWEIADIWSDDENKANRITNTLIACLNSCAENGVPIMVSHAYLGFDDPDAMPNQAGLERFDRVVDEAAKLGVKIAFENTEGIHFLDALLERYKDRQHVGFCFDSGHCNCYTPTRNLLAEYGERLIATHFNDNLGIKDENGKIFWTDDLHLLPFDGTVDWEKIAAELDSCGYDGVMTFELKTHEVPGRHENDKYREMSLHTYLTEAYSRAQKFAKMRKHV